MIYSSKRKSAILSKLLPPYNMTITALSKQESVAKSTIYQWLNKAKLEGKPVIKINQKTNQWTAEVRFSILIETATLSEIELSQYCRKKGLYPEQLLEWKQAFINNENTNKSSLDKTLLNKNMKQIKALEKELVRKDKALAEAAALLVLRKKFNQLHGLEGEEN